MATIKAPCPTCGPVRLRTRDLTVRVCRDDDERAYRFRCPRCSMSVLHDASPAIGALLVSVGVDEEVWERPADLDERPAGPPITADDLLDFHLLLSGEGWEGQLLDGGARDRS